MVTGSSPVGPIFNWVEFMQKQNNEMAEFEKQQKIEKYLFNKKQTWQKLINELNINIDKINKGIEKQIRICKEYGQTIDPFNHFGLSHSICDAQYIFKDHDIHDILLRMMEFLLTDNKLMFTFGKYKGYYVDMILHSDKKYCEWFINNIHGIDFNTLKILDYFCKIFYVKDKYTSRYYFDEPNKILTNVKQYVDPLYHKFIDDAYLLDKFTYRRPRKDYPWFDGNCGDEMPDLRSYEDDNSEFCYYGDMLVSDVDLY